MPKSYRISIRVDGPLKARLQKVTEEAYVTEASLVTGLVKAVCEYWDDHHELRLPLAVVPKLRLEELERLESAPQNTGIRNNRMP